MNKYEGFADRDDVAREFNVGTGDRWKTVGDGQFVVADDFPTDDEILVANYETPPYEGYAFVLYTRDGRLFEVNASHCSCYGLEGQWQPEETSWESLLMRPASGYNGFSQDVVERLKVLAQQAQAQH